MSLPHRWSLPNRTLTRGKSQDNDSTQLNKFLTFHVSNPGIRRRAGLSTAFADLFGETENRRDSTTTDGGHLAAKELQPLSPRIENAQSPEKPKCENHDAEFHRPDTPVSTTLRLRKRNQSSPTQIEPEETCLSDISKESNPCAQSPGGETSTDIKSLEALTKVRSASSSYPSEGIRSSPDHCCSPSFNILPKHYTAEISRYCPYSPPKPSSRESSGESSFFTNAASVLDAKVGQCLMEELAAAGGTSDTDTRTTSMDYTLKPPFSDINSTEFTSIESLQTQRDKLPEKRHDNGLSTGSNRMVRSPEPSIKRMLGMLDGHGSSTAIRSSFPGARSSTRDSSYEDYIPFRPSNTGSTDRLRVSTESRATRPCRVHWPTKENAYSTMPASVSLKRSPRRPLTEITSHSENSQIPGLHLKEANGSSTTLVQRIQKFKFRKWIKKVCVRTRVRFDNAMKVEASPKALERKKSKSEKSRRPKKHDRAKRAKSRSNSVKAYWKPVRTPKMVRMSSTKEHEGKTNRFMRALKTRKSMQLPVQDKSSAGHRRVQSCPA
ncbi:hypothetical protein F4819DRAFT_298154 [Hypoxylon fuscum]|nr:hypothetical protein F4819DRAFT_298154 [Hypoxylon fuscum]